jgi:predicted glycoside hydrolase/deacetylase ChbG (UPF0249 family)
MPHRRIEITQMGARPARLSLENYLRLLRNLPEGISEFVVHPGYVDDDLRRWSTYLESREIERKLLLTRPFKEALCADGIGLIGYAAIPAGASLREHQRGH